MLPKPSTTAIGAKRAWRRTKYVHEQVRTMNKWITYSSMLPKPSTTAIGAKKAW